MQPVWNDTFSSPKHKQVRREAAGLNLQHVSNSLYKRQAICQSSERKKVKWILKRWSKQNDKKVTIKGVDLVGAGWTSATKRSGKEWYPDPRYDESC